MRLSDRTEDIWNELRCQKRTPFSVSIHHDPDDTSLEEPGIYAVWEEDELLYLGIATKSRPHQLSKRLLRGLKDRLESHRRGQISGSSLAMALWFDRLATSEDHGKIAKRQLNPSALTEEYIQKRLSYTCLTIPGAAKIERELCSALMPPLNAFQIYLKDDYKARHSLGKGNR